MSPKLERQVGSVDDEEDDGNAVRKAQDVGVGRGEVLYAEVGDESVVGDGDDAVYACRERISGLNLPEAAFAESK
jgi:hypothetical protein